MKRTEAGLQVLRSAMEKGLADSAAALSAMTTGGIQLTDPELRLLPLQKVSEIAGGPACVVVAVYLRIHGDLHGHAMFLFSEESALRVSELLKGDPPGSAAKLDEEGLSALAEAGNICCSACLSALSDQTGLVILPTPPTVVQDMAGAILDPVISHLYMGGDETLVVETRFNHGIPGYFLLLPDQDSMAKLIAVLEALQ